jgi:enamine deaminase RidA (YjgF/YER057c/UK114 family)
VERRLISSGSAWERVYGYSRAVVVGDRIHVAGTCASMPDGAPPPADAAAQARRCWQIIGNALTEAGAALEDIVRTRTYLTRLEDFDAVGRVHGELFAETRPANTTVVVEALVDPSFLLEIEAEAALDRRSPS